MSVSRFSRLVALLAAVAITAPAAVHAGAVVTHEISRDDGGYINIGTQGNLGSTRTSTAGKAFCFWLRTVDSGNIIPMGFNFFAYPAMGPQYGLFQINSYWTTDYFGRANAVNYYLPTDSATWAFWKDTGVNFNDGAYHHHCLTWVGYTSSKPTQLDYYIDGVVTGGSWTDYSDGTASDINNFAQNIFIGCTQKSTGPTLADFASLYLEDYRIYDRGLTAAEVFAIYKLRGRDMNRRGLLSRYPFMTNWLNIGYNGVAAVPANDNGTTPTLETTKHLSGQRRRVMHFDVQRMLERPANEDRQLAEPFLRRAA